MSTRRLNEVEIHDNRLWNGAFRKKDDGENSEMLERVGRERKWREAGSVRGYVRRMKFGANGWRGDEKRIVCLERSTDIIRTEQLNYIFLKLKNLSHPLILLLSFSCYLPFILSSFCCRVAVPINITNLYRSAFQQNSSLTCNRFIVSASFFDSDTGKFLMWLGMIMCQSISLCVNQRKYMIHYPPLSCPPSDMEAMDLRKIDEGFLKPGVKTEVAPSPSLESFYQNPGRVAVKKEERRTTASSRGKKSKSTIRRYALGSLHFLPTRVFARSACR